MGLRAYIQKRNFKETTEPKGGKGTGKKLIFVVQRHHASSLHYDFRLEMDGVLKSWAIPKGPSLNSKDKRLAMMVEDHPYNYRNFEGVIPEGNYGAGLVHIFDEGTYESLAEMRSADHKELKKGLTSGNLKFRLYGKILKGEFALVKLKNADDKSWLLIKHKDEYAVDSPFNAEDLIPQAIKERGIGIKMKPGSNKRKPASSIKKDPPSAPLKRSKTTRASVSNGLGDGKNEENAVIEKTSVSPPRKDGILPAEKELHIGSKNLKLTNLTKLYWKNENISKGQLIEYYQSIADYILPYLKDRPLSLNRHPNGIDAPGFFQKDLHTDHIPGWIKYAPLYADSTGKDIDYLICNNLPTLLWMANLGCIEINPWLSTYKKPESPIFAVMDLDPNDVDDFGEVVKVALTAKNILDQMGIKPYIKTSGSRGLHIFIHIGGKYDYDISRKFIEYLGHIIMSRHPETTSLERSPSKRKKKIYLDFLQNSRGQTIAAPYSVRPKPGATVSTPLEWSEVTESIDIKQFTIFNTLERVKRKGDPWAGITSEKTDLKKALKALKQESSPG